MRTRGVASVLAIGAALLLGGTAFAQAPGGDDTAGGVPSQDASSGSPFGSFNIKGLIRNETSISVSDHNEFAGARNGGENKRDLNLLAVRGEANVYWRYSSQLTGYGKLRAWADFANKVDDAYPNHVDVMNGQRGDGASRLSKSGDNWIVDIPQVYIDWRPGPFWVRVGKQQIAWGEALLLNTVDVVDSLDLRRHYFLDVLGEEVADERTGNNGIRGGIQLGNTGWELEMFFTDFHPTIFPGDTCSPYSVFPCISAGNGGRNPSPVIRDHSRYRAAENNWDYGGRFHGNIGQVETFIGFISHPNSNGVILFDHAKANGQLVFNRRFPRENILVWGANYLMMSESGESFWDGTVLRWDGGYTFKKAIAVEGNSRVIHRDQISTAIQIEKQFRWSLSQPSMFAFMQPMWFRTATGPYSGAYLHEKHRNHFLYSAIGFNQQIGNGSLRYDWLIAHDWKGGNLMQTGFLWKPSGNYQIDIYYSRFSGGDLSEFGNSTFGHFDELFWRLTRYF